MKRKFHHCIISLSLLFISAYSNSCYAGDIVQVVNNILAPMSAFTDAFYKICYALGALLIAGSAIQYSLYRKNPIQVKFSNVVFLLLIGIVVVCLPFIVRLSSSANVIDQALSRQQQQTIVRQPEPAKPAYSHHVVDDDWYNNP